MPANKERLGCTSVKVTIISPDAQSNHGLFSSSCWTSIIMCRGLCCVSSLLQDRLLDYHPSETSVFVGAQERKDGFKSSPSRNILYLSHSCVISKTSHMPAGMQTLEKMQYNPALYPHTLKVTIHPAMLPFSCLQNNLAHFWGVSWWTAMKCAPCWLTVASTAAWSDPLLHLPLLCV